ncbi:MAG: class I SAM-dependent methyltransferase [Candidatus Omnitrophota bacterium]
MINYSFKILKTRISSFFEYIIKYQAPDGYNAEKYWADRFCKYGFDLSGVGDIDLTNYENEQVYNKAKETFLSLCRDEGIDFNNISILDIGCGTGFYTEALFEKRAKQYLGIDITDVLFGRLKQRFPQFQFHKLDITARELNGGFDLIIMIDITQHITNEKKFSFAMQNVKSHLNRGGIFIVTSWLDAKIRRSLYEISRSIDAYKREFPGYIFSSPVSFRDKFIFSIKTPK